MLLVFYICIGISNSEVHLHYFCWLMELKLQGQIQLFLIWDDVVIVLSECKFRLRISDHCRVILMSTGILFKMLSSKSFEFRLEALLSYSDTACFTTGSLIVITFSLNLISVLKWPVPLLHLVIVNVSICSRVIWTSIGCNFCSNSLKQLRSEKKIEKFRFRWIKYFYVFCILYYDNQCQRWRFYKSLWSFVP